MTHANLPHISTVQPRTSADDALFADIAEVLRKHNATERFGINLLHSHFPMNENEVLLERTDEENRVQVITPTTEEPAESIETMWSFGEDGKVERRCICQMYAGKHTGSHISVGR